MNSAKKPTWENNINEIYYRKGDTHNDSSRFKGNENSLTPTNSSQ